jgi:ketosteroid isomerase-like protein
MNEQDNVTLVQNCYAAFARGDVATILNALSPDVEWTLEGPEIIPFAGHRNGLDEVAKFFEALATTQTGQKLTISQFIAQDDVVATVGRYSAVVVATGKQIDGAVAHFFTIRDGKIVKLQDFADTAQMAEAYAGTAASVTA